MKTVNDVDTTESSGAEGTVRVSDDDNFSSSWYARFTKLEDSIRVDLFLPTGADSPNAFDFETQLFREQWNRCVNNHSTYEEFSATIAVESQDFDSVNIFSNIDSFDTQQLRSVEWLGVRAVRIE